MKLYCPTCGTMQIVKLIFHAETAYNTETRETVTDDVDFSHAECAKCYTWLGDEISIPEIKPILVELGWSKFK